MIKKLNNTEKQMANMFELGIRLYLFERKYGKKERGWQDSLSKSLQPMCRLKHHLVN